MANENLWGFAPLEEPIRTPVQTLREQAEQFNLLWKNSSLYADVVQGQNDKYSQLEYSLKIIAPVLNGYTLNVLTIRYSLPGYPVQLYSDFGGVQYREETRLEEDYLTWISKILSDPKLGQSINSLAAHSISN